MEKTIGDTAAGHSTGGPRLEGLMRTLWYNNLLALYITVMLPFVHIWGRPPGAATRDDSGAAESVVVIAIASIINYSVAGRIRSRGGHRGLWWVTVTLGILLPIVALASAATVFQWIVSIHHLNGGGP
jgi:hypothetical protein